jgi:hypothetical protein
MADTDSATYPAFCETAVELDSRIRFLLRSLAGAKPTLSISEVS